MGRLDQGGDGVADGQLQGVGAFDGDGGGQGLAAADVDGDLAVDGAVLAPGDGSGDLVAGRGAQVFALGQDDEAGLDQGSNALSKERIIEIDPDVFLLPTWNFDSNNDVQKYAQQVAADPAFKNIKAIKNNRLEFVSDRYRYVASQHVTDSIEAVAKAVYPELFAKGE